MDAIASSPHYGALFFVYFHMEIIVCFPVVRQSTSLLLTLLEPRALAEGLQSPALVCYGPMCISASRLL